MKYIVSGSKRTGTSCMMAALTHGNEALDLLVAPAMEDANPELNGYQPNPNGLYEVGVVKYLDPKFLRGIPDDCLIKILYDGLPILPKGDYKIIFMERDEAEIRASESVVDKHFIEYEKATGRKHTDHHEHTQLLPFCCLRPYSKEDVGHVLGICEARKDFDIMVINYAEVIDNPLKVFNTLKEWGWPIDPEKCSGTIDKSLYRVRKESDKTISVKKPHGRHFQSVEELK
jgi:hypothetical protein